MELRQIISVYDSRRAIDVEGPYYEKKVAYTAMLQWQQHNSFFDDALGLSGAGTDVEIEDGEFWYWVKVRSLVLDCIRIGQWRNVTDVLLVGEMAGDERVWK